MSPGTERILKAALKADGGVTDQQIARALAFLRGEDKALNQKKAHPRLVDQATAARLASVSRFTIRRMTELGRLHPVELLPGLLRYRVEEVLRHNLNATGE